MAAFLADVTSLVDKQPPASVQRHYDRCELIPWHTRRMQGIRPLVAALQMYTIKADRLQFITDNHHLAADIAASYVIDATDRGFFYAPPSIQSDAWSPGEAILAVVRALQAERDANAALSRTPMDMTLLNDGRVSVSFP